jgi:hypothetical protein
MLVAVFFIMTGVAMATLSRMGMQNVFHRVLDRID